MCLTHLSFDVLISFLKFNCSVFFIQISKTKNNWDVVKVALKNYWMDFCGQMKVPSDMQNGQGVRHAGERRSL